MCTINSLCLWPPRCALPCRLNSSLISAAGACRLRLSTISVSQDPQKLSDERFLACLRAPGGLPDCRDMRGRAVSASTPRGSAPHQVLAPVACPHASWSTTSVTNTAIRAPVGSHAAHRSPGLSLAERQRLTKTRDRGTNAARNPDKRAANPRMGVRAVVASKALKPAPNRGSRVEDAKAPGRKSDLNQNGYGPINENS